MVHKIIRSALLVSTLAYNVFGELAVKNIFNKGIILQRSQAVPIWGTAPLGANIAIVFGDQQPKAKYGISGVRRILLDPLAVTSESQKQFIASDMHSIVIDDILVGGIWLASGQPNMDNPLGSNKFSILYHALGVLSCGLALVFDEYGLRPPQQYFVVAKVPISNPESPLNHANQRSESIHAQFLA